MRSCNETALPHSFDSVLLATFSRKGGVGNYFGLGGVVEHPSPLRLRPPRYALPGGRGGERSEGAMHKDLYLSALSRRVEIADDGMTQTFELRFLGEGVVVLVGDKEYVFHTGAEGGDLGIVQTDAAFDQRLTDAG
mgnify:CR=1 FL=1